MLRYYSLFIDKGSIVEPVDVSCEQGTVFQENGTHSCKTGCVCVCVCVCVGNKGGISRMCDHNQSSVVVVAD